MKKGYGVVYVGSGDDGSYRSVRAHRLSYVLTNRDVLGGQVLVCHKCDVRRCVNPDHLFVGTNEDNVADCLAKGRTARGKANGMMRITDAKVLEIRRRVDLSHVKAGQEFGLSDGYVRRLRAGIFRREVGGLRVLSSYEKGIREIEIHPVDVILAIRRRTDLCQSEASREFGVSCGYVRKVRSGKVRRAVGGIRPLSEYTC